MNIAGVSSSSNNLVGYTHFKNQDNHCIKIKM